ncbi:MAG: type II secretion system protein [Verrucomicrobiota bacterium]
MFSLPFQPTAARLHGFSLVEVLASISILGILTFLAVISIGRLTDQTDVTKDRANAQHIAQISSALNAMGVAHVLPDSLGGAEATARLLRNGIIVPDGPFAGQTFTIKSLSDHEIAGASNHLTIIFDLQEVRMLYDPKVERDFPTAGVSSSSLFASLPPFEPSE